MENINAVHGSKWTSTKSQVNGQDCEAFAFGGITVPFEIYKDKDESGIFYVASMLGELPEGIGLDYSGTEVHHYAPNGFGRTKAEARRDFLEQLELHTPVHHDCEKELC